MEKRVFSIALTLLSLYIIFSVAKHMSTNNVQFNFAENNLESVMESGFPMPERVREFYGAVNKILTPYEVADNGGAIVKDADGYLLPINLNTDFDVEMAVNKLVELENYCNDQGIKFSYVSYPSKCDASDYADGYGIQSNSEEIREELLSGLDDNDIHVLNVRDMLEAKGLSRKDIFYKTDHHWNTRSGLFAAHAIAEYLEDEFGISTQPEKLDPKLFTYVEYPKSWFGETGRLLSKTWVGSLDDFTLITPNYDTSLQYTVFNDFNREGDFSILFDGGLYETEFDLYTTSLHYSYMPRAYYNNVIVLNKNIECGAKVLIIKDSFTIAVAPFLSLACEKLNMWDMRKHEGSIYNYIKENDFDVVMVAYTDFFSNDMYEFN